MKYKLIKHLTSWLLPTKEDRKNYRELLNDIDERKNIEKAHLNFKKLLYKIKNKKTKIRVVFLVNELSKWKAQSLFDLMKNDKDFEPIIALNIADFQCNYTKAQKKECIIKNKAYFDSKNIKTVFAYDFIKDKPINLKTLKADIIFYQQPWNIYKNQTPKAVSAYCLPCYIPYYVNNYNIIPMDYELLFHKYLFRYYVTSAEWEDLYKQKSSLSCIRGTGHTMLDSFYLNKNKVENKDYVIYAPHWSFSHELNINNENYGTFLNNGKQILEFAKKHNEINWVFKPHPTLKHTLIKIGIPQEEVDSYYKEWEKIGIACYDSSYIDLFLSSKALITDCGSFLTEYFCTGKPLIHLISPNCKVKANAISEKMLNSFYKVHNLDEMYKIFKEVIIDNNDTLKETRQKALKESGLENNYAAKNIIEDLRQTIFNS